MRGECRTMRSLRDLSGGLRRALAHLRRNEGGNVAVLFGLTLIPLGGLVGIALDYNRAIELRTFMHRETDSAALSIASSDAPNTDTVIGSLKARIAAHLGSDSGITNVATESSWEGASRFTMTTTAQLQTTLSALLPSGLGSIPLSVTTTVQRNAPQFKWSLPTIKDLSYEAADYNRISVYCYNDAKKNEANKGRRLETLTAISDNGGTDYSKAKLPACDTGETMSYQLRNVRNSRTTPSNWDKPSAEHYLYFTDTTIDPNTRVMTNNITGGREASNGTITPTDLTKAPLLETIICTSGVDCTSRSSGGILPNNHDTGRTPKVATSACSEGKSMYFGWEDRPPTSPGASDQDYDDIRIVVSCPTLEKIGAKEVRIIR